MTTSETSQSARRFFLAPTNAGGPMKRTCPVCRGPMPAPAWTGRPRIYCSIDCRDRAAGIRQGERERRDRERLQAEENARREAREEKEARRREQDYQRALKAGGDVAAEAKWQRLSAETLDATGGRYDLCQWAEDTGPPHACTNRTANVYCAMHNRQVEREAAAYRRAQGGRGPEILGSEGWNPPGAKW